MAKFCQQVLKLLGFFHAGVLLPTRSQRNMMPDRNAGVRGQLAGALFRIDKKLTCLICIQRLFPLYTVNEIACL